MKKYFNAKKTIFLLFLLYSYHITEPSKRIDLTGKRVAYLHPKSADIFQKKSTDVQLLFLIKIEDFYQKQQRHAPIDFLPARLSSEARNSAYQSLFYLDITT